VSQALRRLTTPTMLFSLKPFLKRFALRRLTTPTMLFSLKPFLKRLAPFPGFFDHIFFEKVCDQVFCQKGL
jgi:hypothetical protein